jgi:hypothetical protein
MIDIKNLTLKELITDHPDLVQAIKNGEDKGTTSSCVEKDEKKRVTKWAEERRDTLKKMKRKESRSGQKKEGILMGICSQSEWIGIVITKQAKWISSRSKFMVIKAS